MHFSHFSSVKAIAFLSFVSSSLAAATTRSQAPAAGHVFDSDKPKALIDYSPPFTYPTGGQVFTAGQTTSVSWDQTELYPPENVTRSADLLLGYTEAGSAALHLFWTLAQGVPMYAPNPNKIDIQLPANLTTRDT
ncbi:hypothetical protein ACM66B_006190 [Microbotryomycetes sp. NB124-2]